MFCNNCGVENQDGDMFCKNCGASLVDVQQNKQENYQQPNYQQMNYQQPNYQQMNYQQPNYQQPPADKGDYTPISMWGYFGYEILFAIPCIGLILLLIFSFGGTQNVNLKNFARSYFCFLIIAVVMMLLLSVLMASSSFGSYY